MSSCHVSSFSNITANNRYILGEQPPHPPKHTILHSSWFIPLNPTDLPPLHSIPCPTLPIPQLLPSPPPPPMLSPVAASRLMIRKRRRGRRRRSDRGRLTRCMFVRHRRQWPLRARPRPLETRRGPAASAGGASCRPRRCSGT